MRFLLFLLAPALAAEVTLTQDAVNFTLANGIATAQINKTTGDLTSLKYKGVETLGFVSGHHAGYWEQNPSRAARVSATVTIDPASNNATRAEVSVKGFADSKPISQPRGPILDLEIRYTMDGTSSGLYTYAIFSHGSTYPATQLGESRFGAKLNATVFDWLSIDAKRNRLMPTGGDWDKGSALNMKEARRMTTGVYKGIAEHKYDYTADQFEIPAFGWSSTKQHIGFYLINPSMEYLSSGPYHFELTGHLDDGDGGDPTILDYWRGTHYGGSVLPVAEGETWTKVVGPIFIYLNALATPEAMFTDALAQSRKEAAQWPYSWVNGVDYPAKSARATVTGQLTLNDPLTHTFENSMVGLAFPDSPEMTWQNDAKHYEFWTRATRDGRFTIPNVRPGTYQLHAISDGVLGEYSKTPITVTAAQALSLGTLEWKPVRYGRQLWDIGIPNRSAREFFKGDDYFHWGWYIEYPKLFPNDVTYTVGKSDYRKDWFFEQVPHALTDDDTGRARGRATSWTINFTLTEAPQGRATLRLALTGVAARALDVTVNGQPAGSVTGLTYNATINRDGIQGSWVEKDLSFDAALMKAGANTLVLTVPAGGLTAGIMYDYLRLELAPN